MTTAPSFDKLPQVANSDSYMDGYMQDELELDALALGGQPFLNEIHDEASAHVDEHHPWAGSGDEPPERVSAYLAVLWQRVEIARANQARERRVVGADDAM